MILSRMTAAGKDGSRVTLWFEDGSKLRVATGLIADFSLYAGMNLDDEELERLSEAARKASARSRAVRIVSAASVSEKDLKRRLVQKGEEPEDAAEAAKWLRDLGAVDDRAMARRVRESCIRKGYGETRARYELQNKGICREYADEALEDYPDMADAIDEFLRRRFRDGAPDEKEIKKAADALQRRGHGWSAISAGLRRYKNSLECEDWDE